MAIYFFKLVIEFLYTLRLVTVWLCFFIEKNCTARESHCEKVDDVLITFCLGLAEPMHQAAPPSVS